MRNAISGAWISALLTVCVLVSFPTLAAQAQERPWEIATFFEPYDVHYAEYALAPTGERVTVSGDGVTAASLRGQATFHARENFHVPLFVNVEAAVPIMEVQGKETGTFVGNGTTYTTQKENVRHTMSWLSGAIGFELLPSIQPFVELEFNELASRRTGQVEGQDDGTFVPSEKQDYVETVASSHLGLGLQGVVLLNADTRVRLRYSAEYQTPQSVSVTNTYFDAGTWGEGATGYSLKGRICLDLPIALTAAQARRDGYVSVGAFVLRRHWNGDGRVGTEIFASPQWPENTVLALGAFIGTGVFF